MVNVAKVNNNNSTALLSSWMLEVNPVTKEPNCDIVEVVYCRIIILLNYLTFPWRVPTERRAEFRIRRTESIRTTCAVLTRLLLRWPPWPCEEREEPLKIRWRRLSLCSRCGRGCCYAWWAHAFEAEARSNHEPSAWWQPLDRQWPRELGECSPATSV